MKIGLTWDDDGVVSAALAQSLFEYMKIRKYERCTGKKEEMERPNILPPSFVSSSSSLKMPLMTSLFPPDIMLCGWAPVQL